MREEIIGANLSPGSAFLTKVAIPTYDCIVDYETVWIPAHTVCMVLEERNRSYCCFNSKQTLRKIIIEYDVLVNLSDGNWAVYPVSSAALGDRKVQLLVS